MKSSDSQKKVNQSNQNKYLAILVILVVGIIAIKYFNSVFWVILLILMYFLPSFIAIYSNHTSTVAVFTLNLFLGWTFIGWVISLVWALKNQDSMIVINNQSINPYEDLEALSRLRDKGIIDDDEFIKKKRQILEK